MHQVTTQEEQFPKGGETKFKNGSKCIKAEISMYTFAFINSTYSSKYSLLTVIHNMLNK
jgi:hypothetical protein